MADTARTLAALQTLLADNATGDISAQDLRDMLVSLQNDHGEMSVTSAIETSIASADTFYPVLGTQALSSDAQNFTMPTNGRLTYTGNEVRTFHIAVSLSIVSAGNNKVYEFTVGKNGSALTAPTQARKIATGADVGSTALHAFTTMDTNDYLELMISNTTDTTNATLNYANLFAMGMLH